MDSLLLLAIALTVAAVFANLALSFGEDSRDWLDRRDAAVRS